MRNAIHKGRKRRRERAIEETAKLVRVVLVICSTLSETFLKLRQRQSYSKKEVKEQKHYQEKREIFFEKKSLRLRVCSLQCAWLLPSNWFHCAMASRNVDWAQIMIHNNNSVIHVCYSCAHIHIHTILVAFGLKGNLVVYFVCPLISAQMGLLCKLLWLIVLSVSFIGHEFLLNSVYSHSLLTKHLFSVKPIHLVYRI